MISTLAHDKVILGGVRFNGLDKIKFYDCSISVRFIVSLVKLALVVSLCDKINIVQLNLRQSENKLILNNQRTIKR